MLGKTAALIPGAQPFGIALSIAGIWAEPTLNYLATQV